jgi:hypothetical protein
MMKAYLDITSEAMPEYLHISLGLNVVFCIIFMVVRMKYIASDARKSQIIQEKEQAIATYKANNEALNERFVSLGQAHTDTLTVLESLKIELATARRSEEQEKVEQNLKGIKVMLCARQQELATMEQTISMFDNSLLKVDQYVVERVVAFDTSDEIKEKIKAIKIKQKEMYEDASAITVEFGYWEIQKSEWCAYEIPRLLRKTANTFFAKSSYSFLDDFNQWPSAVLLLHAFDLKCETIIKNLKYTTLTKSISDIKKAARKLDTTFVQQNVPIPKGYFQECKNGLNTSVEYPTIATNELDLTRADEYRDDEAWGHLTKRVEGEPVTVWSTDFNLQISNHYIQQKLEELALQFEYIEQKQLEKEALQEAKDRAKELAKAKKDAEEKEVALSKEIEATTALTSEVSGGELQALLAKIESLKEQLSEAHQQKERAISMAQQTKSGYVYVISNIGTMGEGIVKIGMTRRLDPMERVKELGDASVPFTFDVHTLIQTDDAPMLERELHKKFKRHRVNLVNNRKEFFKVELEEVKKALEELYPGEFDFIDSVDASDYSATLQLQEHMD